MEELNTDLSTLNIDEELSQEEFNTRLSLHVKEVDSTYSKLVNKSKIYQYCFFDFNLKNAFLISSHNELIKVQLFLLKVQLEHLKSK